jgi:hypothetical protein
MRALQVGKIFEEGKTKYQEGVKFDFDQSGGTLFLFFKNPTGEEINSIQKGKLQIGMYENSKIIFMLFKFENMEWMDAPYNVHLSPPYELQFIRNGIGYGMTIFLINANTGILEAGRLIGWRTDMSRKFKEAVECQRSYRYDTFKYTQTLNQVYGNYSTKDMVERADIYRFEEEDK